jgi:glycosyltransferase involved in cell wall biosynthesis
VNLLFVQPTWDKRGHYSLWTSRLCQALGRTGHNICLFTNKADPRRYIDEPLSFRVLEAGNGEFAFDRFDDCILSRPWYYWYGYFRSTHEIVKRAFRLCRDERFDALYLTDAEYMLASLAMKRSSHWIPPIVWHVQAANFTFDTYQGSLVKKLYKTFQRQVFRRVIGGEVKAFAVLGEYQKQKLQAQLRIEDTFPIGIQPDGADSPEQSLDKLTARRQLNIEYSGPVFLFFGMLRKDKGVDCLIKAASLLKGRDFRIVIAGAPFDYGEAELRAMLIRHGVTEEVLLRLGYVPDEQVPLYYSCCDAVVFPYAKSYVGGSGPLTKGACSYGKPVIASNVSEMGRIVQNEGFGLLAEPENAVSLSQRMGEFLALSEQQRALLSQNAAAAAREHSWDAVAGKLIDFIEEVVSSNTPDRVHASNELASAAEK